MIATICGLHFSKRKFDIKCNDNVWVQCWYFTSKEDEDNIKCSYTKNEQSKQCHLLTPNFTHIMMTLQLVKCQCLCTPNPGLQKSTDSRPSRSPLRGNIPQKLLILYWGGWSCIYHLVTWQLCLVIGLRADDIHSSSHLAPYFVVAGMPGQVKPQPGDLAPFLVAGLRADYIHI